MTLKVSLIVMMTWIRISHAMERSPRLSINSAHEHYEQLSKTTRYQIEYNILDIENSSYLSLQDDTPITPNPDSSLSEQ